MCFTDVVLLTGGYANFQSATSRNDENFTSVEVWDPLGQCQVQLPQLPIRRVFHSSHYTYSDGRLLLCGLDPDSGFTSCSHWVDGKFKHHSQLLESRMMHAGVTMGDYIYLAGGMSGGRSMESLSGGNTWSRGADMLQGREGACAVATSNTTFIVIGGMDDGSVPWFSPLWSSVQEFNTVTGTWRRRAELPGWGRAFHRCVNIGGDILVAGGASQDWKNLDSALLYSVDTNTWRTAARLNQKKSFGEMVVVNGRILYLGGKQAM